MMQLGMEEVESSECSSGCQSGWTMYLEQSYEPPTTLHFKKGVSFQEEGEEEEEEDLSMISDASSGPPHFIEEDQFFCYCNAYGNGCLCSSYASSASASLAKKGGKKRRVESEKEKELSSPLDDTASSPLFNYSKESFHTSANAIKPTVENAVEFSCAFSATHYKKHLGYMQSPAPAKPTPPPRPVDSLLSLGMQRRR